MINFRFHIVSLVAIFLALALGVVIGAGVIDRGVVDTLNDRLDKVEAKADKQQVENDNLRAANDRIGDFAAGLQASALAGTLAGEQVALVAVRGVDEDRVTATVTTAKQAGATVTGVLWIEGKWGEAGESARTLAGVIGQPATRGAKLRDSAWSALADRLARPAVLPSESDLLVTLANEGFVTFAGVEGGLTPAAFPGRSAHFVLVIGEEADVPSDDVVMPAATAFAADKLDLVIADVFVDLELGPIRGGVFKTLRASELARTTSTVDDLDLAEGPYTVAATVFGFTCTPREIGHYGYGPDTVPWPPAGRCSASASPAVAR